MRDRSFAPPLLLFSSPFSTVDDHSRQDEEHKLIARYTSRLADSESSGVSRYRDRSDAVSATSALTNQTFAPSVPGDTQPEHQL